MSTFPGWKMERINLALPHGNGSDYPGGGGQLLKDTLLYNFGIPVDYYIRIGFEGFKQVVDLLGGVEIVVNCRLTDWRLKYANGTECGGKLGAVYPGNGNSTDGWGSGSVVCAFTAYNE